MEPADRRDVLVVEDDQRFIADLSALASGWNLAIRFATNIEEARRAAAARLPEVAFVDLDLPDGSGIDLITSWTGEYPGLPLVVLTVAASESKVLAAIRAGAIGYLLKADMGRDRFLQAIEEARTGGAPLSGAAARLLMRQLRAPAPRQSDLPELTPREQQTLQLLSEGVTYAQAAESLGVSINSVRSHVRRIYEKFAVGTKTEAVLVAMRLGLVRPPATSPR